MYIYIYMYTYKDYVVSFHGIYVACTWAIYESIIAGEELVSHREKLRRFDELSLREADLRRERSTMGKCSWVPLIWNDHLYVCYIHIYKVYVRGYNDHHFNGHFRNRLIEGTYHICMACIRPM